MRPVRYFFKSEIKDGVYWFRYNPCNVRKPVQKWECVCIHTSDGIRWIQRFVNYQERLDAVIGLHCEDFQFIHVPSPE